MAARNLKPTLKRSPDQVPNAEGQSSPLHSSGQKSSQRSVSALGGNISRFAKVEGKVTVWDAQAMSNHGNLRTAWRSYWDGYVAYVGPAGFSVEPVSRYTDLATQAGMQTVTVASMKL